MKCLYTILALLFILIFPVIGQTNISLEASTKTMNLSFSEISEESMDDQIQRSKEYLNSLKEWLPKDTEEYEKYLKEHSLTPVPDTRNHEDRIRQLEKIRELMDLEIQTKLLQERLGEIARKRARLPYFSPTGLRAVEDHDGAIEILSNAKKVLLYGDMVYGDWEEYGFGYPWHKAGALTIEDPEIIKSILKLIKSSEFKYDSEWTQTWLEGSKIGTKQHFLLEVDDKAYVYILSDMMICEMQKTYSTTNNSFQAQLALLVPLDEHLEKRSQPEH